MGNPIEMIEKIAKNTKLADIREPFDLSGGVAVDLIKHLAYYQPYYLFLYRLNATFKFGKIVEIGTGWGTSSCFLALGNCSSEIISIDVSLDSIKKAGDLMALFGLKNVEFWYGDSTIMSSAVGDNSVDLIFVDGDHRYDYAKQDVDLYWSKLKVGGIMLLDDIKLDEDMKRVWGKVPGRKIELDYVRNSFRPDMGKGFGVSLKEQ